MEMMLDVPYRCPRCGGTRTFTTLAELKSHMAEEHAYNAQRRQRLRIFDYSPSQPFVQSGRHSPLLQSFLEENQRLEEEVKAAKQEELNNQLQRQRKAVSQLSPSRISSGVSSHATKSGTGPQKRKVNFRTPLLIQEPDAYLQESVSQLNHDMLMQRHQQWRMADALYSTQDVLSGVEEAAEDRVSEQKNFISELTRQLAEKEQQLLALRTELETVRVKEREKDEDETNCMKNSRSHDRAGSATRGRRCIEDELQKKKLELENLNKQLAAAKQTDNRSKEPVSSRRKHELTPEKNRDRREVVVRGQRDSRENNNADVSSQNSEASDGSTTAASLSASRTSSSSVKNRANHLRKAKHNLPTRASESHSRSSSLPHRHQHIHNKLRQDNHQHHQPAATDRLYSQKLKQERQLLVQQMKDLLSKANIDNEKLRDELLAKENHLQFLNQELERTKTDQSELMEETYDLYKEAEKSLAKLKDRLKVKETELEQANTKLEDIRHSHEQLVAEKETVVKSADDKDVLYQNMMKDREQEIQSLKGLLESQQEEREKLKQMADDLKEEIRDKERSQEHLSHAIATKEQELSKAREDIDALTQFLQTAAAKESVARCKLEAFVTELIDRADRAERDLKHLRGLESSSSANMTSDVSVSGGILPRNVKNVNVAQSRLNPGAAAAPVHSTPKAPPQGGHPRPLRAEANQGLQTSLAPWYNDLGMAVSPVVGPPHPSGLAQENPTMAPGVLTSGVPLFPQSVSSQQPQVQAASIQNQEQLQVQHFPAQGTPQQLVSHQMQQTQQDPRQLHPSQQMGHPLHLQQTPQQSYQAAPHDRPLMAGYQAVQVVPQQSQQVVPQQMQQVMPQQMQHMVPQQSQPAVVYQSQIPYAEPTQQMTPQQSPQFVQQHAQQMAPQGQQQLHSGHVHQRQDPQNLHLASFKEAPRSHPQHQSLVSQPYHDPPQRLGHQASSVPSQQVSAQSTFPTADLQQPPSRQSTHHDQPVPQPRVSQPSVHRPNMARRNTNPFVEVYTLQPAQSVSEYSEDLDSQPTAADNSRQPPHHPLSHPDSEIEDSSAYAALPRSGRLGRTDSNPFRVHLASPQLSRQPAAYDDASGPAYSDHHQGHSRDGASPNSHNFLVNSSGKVLHKDRFSSVSSNPFKEDPSCSSSPKSPSKSNLSSRGKASDFERGIASMSVAPDRTYPIFCITGREARELPWEDYSDSNCSYQDTPHFKMGVVHRKPRISRGKGPAKVVGAQPNNMYPRKLYRYRDDSSTDGLELSVDENGILWEVGDSLSESYRMSPYGSETAGDVDTSVLMSSHHTSHRPGTQDGQDTDEDVNSLDEDGILRPVKQDMLQLSSDGILRSDEEVLSPSEENVLQASDQAELQLSEDELGVSVKKASSRTENPTLCLDERITRILKTVGREEDSESLDMLRKQNENGGARDHVLDRNPTSVYGTGRRVPHPRTESPLQRALAVQNRVKSLTYPRAGKKSATMLDTLGSKQKTEWPADGSVGNDSKQTHIKAAEMNGKHTSSLMEGSSGTDDFSSSSYASIPSTLGRKGDVREASNGRTESSSRPSASEVQVQEVEPTPQSMQNSVNGDDEVPPRSMQNSVNRDYEVPPRSMQNSVNRDYEVPPRSMQNSVNRDQDVPSQSMRNNVNHDQKVPQQSMQNSVDHDQKVPQQSMQNNVDHDQKVPQQSMRSNVDRDEKVPQQSMQSNVDRDQKVPQQSMRSNVDRDQKVPQQSMQNNVDYDQKVPMLSLKKGDSSKAAGSTAIPTVNDPLLPDVKTKTSQINEKMKNKNIGSETRNRNTNADHETKHSESVKDVESVTRSPAEQTTDSTPLSRQRMISTSSSKGRDNVDAVIPAKISTVKTQPSSSSALLTRQISVAVEETKMEKLAAAPPKPGRQPRPRLPSQSSVQSSETESVCASPPLALPSPQPRKKEDGDSTDFDLESDLEKVTGGDGGVKTGAPAAGRSGSKRVLKKLKGRKSAGSRKSSQHLAVDIGEDSGSNFSDTDTSSKSQRRENARRRRVALFCIFSYLDTKTLCKMALVCKEWKRISRHPSLWKNVYLKYDRISSKFLVTLAQWCTQVTSLTLEGLRGGNRKPSETLDEYQRRTRGSLEPGLEELLKASQDSLTSLSIVACGNLLTEKCMWLVSGYCRLMQRLTYLSDSHPLTAEVMWALGGGCPSITTLVIPPLFPCHNSEGMNNRCLMLIAQFYPDLLEVGVGGRSIDLTGLVPLVQSCQRLTSLCIDHIKELSDDTVTALCRAGLRQLHQLEVCGMAITANAIRTFHSSCHHLTEIRVFVCINDYFEDTRKKKNKQEYKKIANSLEALKTQAGLGNILQIRTAPVE